MVSLYFVLIAALVLVQTMAFGLFLAEYGAQRLPYAYMINAVLASLVAFLYLKLSERMAFARLLKLNLGFLIAGCLALWLGLVSPAARWTIFLLPAWFQIFINLAHLAVWPLAIRLFDVRQGKRLFGLVGAGNWLANIFAGIAVAPLVAWLGPAQLLPAAALVVTGAFGILGMIARSYLDPSAPATPRHASPGQKQGVRPRLGRYVWLIVGYTALWWVAFFFVDNIFYMQAAGQHPDAAQLTAFIGRVVSANGIIALVVTLFLAGQVLGRFGLQAGLLTMPSLVTIVMATLALGGSLGASVLLLFWLATLGKVMNVALGFSLSRSANGVMYQALPEDQRAHVQTTAEGIVQPLAIGLAGVALFVLTTLLGLSAVGLAWAFLALAAAWLLVTFLVSREYPVALAQALSKRALGEDALMVADQTSVGLLQEHLKSPYPGAVLYALGMLEQLAPEALFAELPRLLDHPAAEVRRAALGQLERLGSTVASTGLAPDLERWLAVEADPEVKAAALQALAGVGGDEALAPLIAALDDPEASVRRGALVGLLRYGGIAGTLAAGQGFNQLISSSSPAERVLAARVLGEVGVTHYYQPLLALLHDPEPEVRRGALRAAGSIKHPRLWQAVVEACASPQTARVAGLALVAGGEAALPEIEIAFARADAPAALLIALARACGRIRGERALRLLERQLEFPDASVRRHVLEALAACGYRAAEAATIHRQLRLAAARAAWIAAALVNLGARETTVLLASALPESLLEVREEVLLLLSFLYDAKAILSAREVLSRGGAKQHAYALEAVETQLPRDLKDLVLPLLEELSPAERLIRLSKVFPQPPQGLSQRLSVLIAGSHFTRWARACALYTAANLAMTECAEDVAMTAETASPGLLRETACWALARLRAEAKEGDKGDSAVLLTIEKVIILRTVGIFSQTPDEVLADVAALLEEVGVAAGETIFHKGEAGDSMYIVVDGKVRVHDGESLLNDLGEREVFGEMALLDAEPRLASVTAVAPTRLFRLPQAAFYELLHDRPEVAIGIIRVLTGYLRARVQDLADVQARLGEL